LRVARRPQWQETRHRNLGLGETSSMDTSQDIGALASRIWSSSARRGPDGDVQIGSLSVRELADRFGTPLFVFDELDFRARCREFRDAFAGFRVLYAGKAFLSRAVARLVKEEGLGLDVCSGGELAVAIAAGFPATKIVMHGNNKSAAELTEALRAGVGTIVVDSFDEIGRLTRLARSRRRRQRVLIRVTVGIDAHTHEHMATGHEDQKFGFSLRSGDAAAAISQILANDTLELRGLHSHIGSQIFGTTAFEAGAQRLMAAYAEVLAVHDLALPELNLGGGFGIAYTEADDPAHPTDIARRVLKTIKQECATLGVDVPQLSVEPGRAIVGGSMLTLYEVGTVKNGGVRNVSVDGGMSDNIRTALYGASYSAVLAGRLSAAPDRAARVVGKHCESGDILVQEAQLPDDIRPGDLIAVGATGAYCRSMASNYNHVPRPAVVSVAGTQVRVIIRRETMEDLLSLDVCP
jgi:diaminopimelate decarboxylase